MGCTSLLGTVPPRENIKEFLKTIIRSDSDDTEPIAEFIQDAQYTTKEDVIQTTAYNHSRKSAPFFAYGA